ncbi:hikeshi-like protein [Rhynchospora pubera]|uniref:Hikeshi-like protein n=1 Tax=Rhynchospora pubera TaxID=906938 RepID=A0AAV8C8M7_9POAL|nr:hikeshi-like protein [Rhynchospora pubera]
MFGLLFPERTYPMDPTSLTQIDPTHWILDLSPFPSPPLHQVCIFLLSPSSLPPTQALSLYFQPSPTHTPSFLFCGALTPDRPSAVLTLPWPTDGETEKSNLGAKIGVCVVDLTIVPPIKDEGEGRRRERMALKVGESLFNYMTSFCGADGGGNIVVPADILDRWFRKFQERARKDPNYLKGFDL